MLQSQTDQMSPGGTSHILKSASGGRRRQPRGFDSAWRFHQGAADSDGFRRTDSSDRVRQCGEYFVGSLCRETKELAVRVTMGAGAWRLFRQC